MNAEPDADSRRLGLILWLGGLRCGDGTLRSGLHALDELREAGELLGHKLLSGLVLEL